METSKDSAAKKKLIIIGAGLSRLNAGVYAQKADDMKRDDQWKDTWDADTVYFSSVNHLSRYLIIYKGTVINLQVNDTLSEMQMKQIRARLCQLNVSCK